MEESKILLDTSILINFQQDHPHTVSQIDIIKEKLFVPRIAANEFIFGSRNKIEKSQNKRFIIQFPIIEINEEISKLSYTLIDQHCLSTGIGLADALIAATAIHLQIPLWTVDHKHLSRIKPLKLHKF